MTDKGGGWLKSSIGSSTPDTITVRGHDLSEEVMGQMTFSELAFLLTAGRVPTKAEVRLFDSVLTSLAEHGLTPTALSARLTYTGAPEAVQGAMAAGLLGGGSVFLGPVADTAEFLGSILAGRAADADDAALGEAASEAVRAAVQGGGRIPGLGHPIHRGADPRTARLYAIAEETGLLGPHMRLLEHVATAHRAQTGKALPVNGAGVAGAALADLGFSPSVARGFALLARAAGLVAHLAEEAERPIGMRLWREVDERAGSEGADDTD